MSLDLHPQILPSPLQPPLFCHFCKLRMRISRKRCDIGPSCKLAYIATGVWPFDCDLDLRDLTFLKGQGHVTERKKRIIKRIKLALCTYIIHCLKMLMHYTLSRSDVPFTLKFYPNPALRTLYTTFHIFPFVTSLYETFVICPSR